MRNALLAVVIVAAVAATVESIIDQTIVPVILAALLYLAVAEAAPRRPGH